ncbi:SRCRL-like protein, partial [Mya arenaria]
MFVWCFFLVLVLLPAAAVGDLEALTLEISNLGRKMDSFQSFVLQDISSIKDKFNKMDSKIDAIIRQDHIEEDKDQAQPGSQTHEASSFNDKIDPMGLQEQLDRIKRGFREEKKGIRHDLDDLKGISQNLLVGKDQIAEYLLTFERNVNTFLSKIIGELKDGVLDITKNVQRDLNTSIERNAVNVDEKVQSFKQLVQRTDTICKSSSDTITKTLTTVLSVSENTIEGYLKKTSLNTVNLINAVKEDINIIKENTAKIMAKSHDMTRARLANENTITNTITKALSASENTITGYLNDTNLNTANLVDAVNEKINVIKENTDDIIDKSNIAVRLANGSEIRNGVQGRLEVLKYGVWGTVCDDGFNDNAAKVACKMISSKFTSYAYKDHAYYGPGTGAIWLDDLNCNGYESSLFNCPGVIIAINNCGHYEDVERFGTRQHSDVYDHHCDHMLMDVTDSQLALRMKGPP